MDLELVMLESFIFFFNITPQYINQYIYINTLQFNKI